ncbi:TonB family protein [Shewanella sp. 202IG2-18]|uniref:TonB family protein n=1 Tax=Parashewanella hymeniacidonis TaxID=2807618 RepID=UPI0019604F2C|nr:TonB family protein [Parashewanella hymeniacidonis]MBM7071679.1 TonB family protein [Parashewanella hymeniacidonis]
MLKNISIPLLVCAISFSSTSQAEGFSESYKTYQQALSGEDKQLIVDTAKSAYQLGMKEYSENNHNIAALLLNYGSAIQNHIDELNVQKDQHAIAYKLYQKALRIYLSQDSKSKNDIIDTQFKLAETAKTKSIAYQHIEDAIDVADGSELLEAKVKLEAFRMLSSKYYSKKLGRFAKEALEIYKEKLPENSMERVRASFNVARIYEAEKKHSKAATLFEEVVKQMDVLDYSHPYKLASHARLVPIYEKQGKSKKSTAHCIAIGKMKPWDDNVQEQIPLYRSANHYPTWAAKKGKTGYVTLEFVINKNGFVEDIEILDSEGGKSFERASIKTLKDWRYAPKFVNGEVVEAKTKIRLDYTLKRPI